MKPNEFVNNYSTPVASNKAPALEIVALTMRFLSHEKLANSIDENKAF